MNNEKLNNLYAKYHAGTNVFNEVYEETKTARDMNRAIVIGQRSGDESDALELFDDVLLTLIREDGIPDFGRALNVRLRRRRIDLLRKTKRRRTRQRSLDEMIDAATDEGAATPEILRSDYDLEHEVLCKKKADHRQVIDFLTNDPRQVDTVTTQIVTEFSQYKSIAALAKALGLHHEVVKRKLTALSRNYDESIFGDYHDYLAV